MIRTDASGVETPLSIMFLMMAFLLIASIGPIFMDSQTEDDLTELKISQARSIGSSIIRSIEFSELNNTKDIEMYLIWDNGMDIYGEDPWNISDQIYKILLWVPSNTWVLVSFRNEQEPIPFMDVDVVSWSAGILDDLDLWVFVPLERSPAPQPGGLP